MALEALEAAPVAPVAPAASAAASREDLKVDEEAEAVSVEASVVAVEVASEAAATLAPEAVTETALEHPTEPHLDLDSTDETEATVASPVVGMSPEVVDAHMRTDPAATEMAAVDLAIVIVVTVATVVTVAATVATVAATVVAIVVTVVTEVTVTAKDVGLAVTWNPLAAGKVGIVTGTLIALAMMTAGNEDTKVVATKIPGNCVATKAGARASRPTFDIWWVN